MKLFFLLIFFVVAIGGLVYLYQEKSPPHLTVKGAQSFPCDGRLYCSQMTSCQEAMDFLKNCPGTKLDGDNDKVPCEKEWCGHMVSKANHF